MQPFAGVLLVWTGTEPRLDTFRIPSTGLVLGRDLLEALETTDDRLSRRHVEVGVIRDRLIANDLRSRNGSHLMGGLMPGPMEVPLPVIVRTGRTIWVVVSDVRPYEHVPITRRGRLVVAGSLDAACRVADEAAREEHNLLLHGAFSVGRELANSYVVGLGRDHVRFDPQSMAIPLERLLEGAARTLVLELTKTLLPTDVETLAYWLETDVRIVTIVKNTSLVPGALLSRLAVCRVDIPSPRLDELPTMLNDIANELAPGATVHFSAIEASLIRAIFVEEDKLLELYTASIRRWREAGESPIRAADLDLDPAPRRRRRPAP